MKWESLVIFALNVTGTLPDASPFNLIAARHDRVDISTWSDDVTIVAVSGADVMKSVVILWVGDSMWHRPAAVVVVLTRLELTVVSRQHIRRSAIQTIEPMTQTSATEVLSTLVAENDNFVSGNRRFRWRFRRLCCRRQRRCCWQRSRLFPDTKLPFSATTVHRTLKGPV